MCPQPLPHGTVMPDLPPSDPRKRKLPLPAFAAAAATAATTSAKIATVTHAKTAPPASAAAAVAAALPKKRVDPRLMHRIIKNKALNEVRILKMKYLDQKFSSGRRD